MAKYRRRLSVVDAEQWFPDREIAGVASEEVWGAIGGRGFGSQTIRQPDAHYVITDDMWKTYLDPGDWIVTGHDGDSVVRRVFKPSEFHADFEPAE